MQAGIKMSANISVLFLCAGKVFYALHEDKVCRGMALMLLQNAVKFNLREFQEVWQQSVPEGMSARLDQLKVRLYLSYILHSQKKVVRGVFLVLQMQYMLCKYKIQFQLVSL